MKQKITVAILSCLAVIVLLAVAVYNGYPLMNPDTGSYVKYAFDFQVPQDRSPFYGVFNGFASLWTSMWFTVIVQSVIVLYLLDRYMQLFESPSLTVYSKFLICCIIAACTHVVWVVSFIMPDIFTAVLLLSILLYLFDNKAPLFHKGMYLLIIAVSTAVHNSHYLISLLLVGLLLFISLVFKRRHYIKRILVLGAICILNCLLLASLNYAKGFGFRMSSGSHVFLTAKFVETGIMKQYLDDSCGSKQLRLCPYRDALPHTLSEYLWEDYSPLYSTGGWQGSETENSQIIHDVFTTPAYRSIFIKSTFVNTIRQIGAVDLPEKITSLDEHSSPYNFISLHLPNETIRYKNAKQYNNQLSTYSWNYVYLLVLIISTIAATFCIQYRTDRKKILYIYTVAVMFILLNAFVTAAFSEVVGRFNYRVLWVIPATNIIILYQRIVQVYNARK